MNEKTVDIVIYIKKGDGTTRLINLTASKIVITAGCLIVIEPSNEVPCETHCYPLATIERFLFDTEAFKNDIVEFK